MNILTDEEIESCSNFSHNRYQFAREIEAKVAKTLRRQVIEEICFKMAAGSPNRERIHKLIDGWGHEH